MNVNEIITQSYDNQKPGIKHAFFIILAYALLSIIIGPIIEFLFQFIPQFNAWKTFVAFSLSFGLLIPVARKIFSSPNLDTKSIPFAQYFIMFPGILALAIIAEGIVSLIPMPDVVANYFASLINFNLPDFLTVAIAAPIFEELIFRGVVLKGFLKKYDPKKAIIWSAAIFGIAHLNPWQFLAAFIVGIAIGWLYWKTKSIWPGIFIHFTNNAFSFYLGYSSNDINMSFAEYVGGTKNYISLLIISIVILYFVGKYFYKYYKKSENEQTILKQ